MYCETISQPVFNGTDNVIRLAVRDEDGVLLSSLAAVTRVTLKLDADTTIDSNADSGVFDWSQTTTYKGQTVGVLSIKLGGLGLTVGTYSDCELTVYDATNANGLRHLPDMTLTVHE